MPPMTEPWYHIIDAPQPLSQGDLILDCPVLVWKRLDPATALPLADRAAPLREDVVVRPSTALRDGGGCCIKGKGNYIRILVTSTR